MKCKDSRNEEVVPLHWRLQLLYNPNKMREIDDLLPTKRRTKSPASAKDNGRANGADERFHKANRLVKSVFVKCVFKIGLRDCRAHASDAMLLPLGSMPRRASG